MKELSEETINRMKGRKPFSGKDPSVTLLSQFAAGQISEEGLKKKDPLLYKALTIDNTPEVFSYNFFRLMYSKGWSATEASRQLDIHRNLVIQLVNGDHLPTMKTVVSICDKLNMSLLDLFGSPINHPNKIKDALDRLESAALGGKKESVKESKQEIEKRLEKLLKKMEEVLIA